MSNNKKPEIEFWLFQHEETGRTMHVDVYQVDNGFETANPKLQKIKPIYNQDSLIAENERFGSELNIARQQLAGLINENEQLAKQVSWFGGFITKVRSESNKLAHFGQMDNYFKMLVKDCNRVLDEK